MPKTTRAALSRYALALASGALLPLTFAPLSWWPLAILSCAALHFALSNTQLRQAWLICLLFGTALYATGASWIYVSIHQYGQASVPLAGLLTGLFALGLGALFTIPLLFYPRINHHNRLLRALAFAALWVLGEWFRGWFLTGFPWLYLGYGFIDTWLAGWAPVSGVLFMSGIVAFTGAAFSETLREALVPSDSNPANNSSGKSTRKATTTKFTINRNLPPGAQPWVAGLTGLLLAILWLGGWLLEKHSWTTALTTVPLKVALVQPNNPVLNKWDKDTLPLILSDIREKTLSLGNNDLVIWPESAIPALQTNIPDFLTELNSMAAGQKTSLIAGIPSFSDGKYYNSVIGLGAASGHYQKRRLVPFGEYVPLEQWLRGLISFFDLPMSAFSAGAEKQALINVGDYKIASAICYEIAYSWPLAKDARQANLLLTVSNDTWFGDSLGPHQHLEIARIRALETGKPLLRATNDGITALIDARGELLSQLPRFTSDVLRGQVTPHQGTSPYSQWGEAPTIGLCFIIVLSTLVLTRRLDPLAH